MNWQRMIDHSLLKQDVTRQDTIEGCELAMKYDVAAATVKSCYTKLAAEVLKGSTVKPNPVIDFPNGYAATADKVFETKRCIDEGAGEIDMVMNLGAFLGGDYDFARDDIAAVVQAAQGAPVKVIFEVYFLKERDDPADQSLSIGGTSRRLPLLKPVLVLPPKASPCTSWK